MAGLCLIILLQGCSWTVSTGEQIIITMMTSILIGFVGLIAGVPLGKRQLHHIGRESQTETVLMISVEVQGPTTYTRFRGGGTHDSNH